MTREGFHRLDLPVVNPVPLLARCGACGLHRKCKSPKMPVSGKGHRKILLVGEAPGKDEDFQNRPFVGASGERLQCTLSRFGVDMRRDCWITNSLRCRPQGNIADPKSIDHCRPYLLSALRDLQPEVVILLGGSAVKSLIGYLWQADPGGVMKWRGRRIPNRQLNAWICPTVHPSYILRQKDQRLSQLLFERDLASILELQGRPYQGDIPDLAKEVEVCLDDARAARVLRKMTDNPRPICIDLETEGLKPEGSLRIYSCAVCWNGKKTIAFMWRGEAVSAVKELLSSGCPIIGHNLKFEERWLLQLGIEITGPTWDSMLIHHLLDNQPGVNDLEFMSFCELGIAPYSREIEPYLKAKKGEKKNKVEQCDVTRLLSYNGMDVIVTYLLAVNQMQTLGMRL